MQPKGSWLLLLLYCRAYKAIHMHHWSALVEEPYEDCQFRRLVH
jgi:hypothetical protein